MKSAYRLTEKGQVTIPVEIREHLGIKPHDRVRFEIREDRAVYVVPAESKIAKIAGSVKPIYPIPTAREIREDFERGVAEEVMREMEQ